MNTVVLVALLIVTGTAAAQTPGVEQRVPPIRVLSASRQIVVFADDSLTASRLCARAENLRRVWLSLLQLPPRWRDPIAIVVSQRNAVFTQPGAGHLKYQVECRLDITDERLDALILEALCRELANRELILTSTTTSGAAVPLWLPVGLRETLEGRPNELLPVIQRCVEGGRPPSLEQVQAVNVWPTNHVEELLFRANAWLLTESLLSLPQGAAKIGKLLTAAAANEPSWTFGTVYGADFSDQTAREKWWSLQLTRKTTANIAEALSATETGAELEDILRTQLTQLKGPPRNVPAGDLGQHDREPWFPSLVRDKADRLQMLHSRAHPLYRETVATYITAFAALRQYQGFRYRSYLKRAQAQRIEADRYCREIDQYVTQVERQHGLADDRALETVAAPPEPPGERRDPLSDYLDQFDK